MLFKLKKRKQAAAAADGAATGAVDTAAAAADTASQTAASEAAVTTAADTTAQADGNADKGDQGDTAKVTEYADFQFPEGFNPDQQVLDAFKATALEVGLTQEQAQKLTHMGALMQQKMLDTHFSAIEQQKADWETTAKADTEYGGAKFEENMRYAAMAAEKFVSDDLKEQLNKTGLGNHPELIRAFVRIGKLISEDSLVTGESKPTDTPKTPAQVLYG